MRRYSTGFSSRLALFGVFGLGLSACAYPEVFEASERRAVQEYWQKVGKIVVESAGPKGQEWVARQTAEGSQYLHAVLYFRGKDKLPPNQANSGAPSSVAAWQAWLDRKYAFDGERAEIEAARRDGRPAPPTTALDPGPAPADMVAALGEPPELVAATRPKRYALTFDDGYHVDFVDNVKVRPKYPYYRFTDGVIAYGTRLGEETPERLRATFAAAGVSDSLQKVMIRVSRLEGGFASVNTYDTGVVSVGFIQFAALQQGGGSLGRMLQCFKGSSPEEFHSSFRRYGIDVTDDGLVAAVDPSTAEEYIGAEACMLIVRDKRLTAVFQRAGEKCEAYRVAQVVAARNDFCPDQDRIQLNLGGKTVSVCFGDVVRSEAGLATLMDRKVNVGNLREVARTLQRLVDAYGITDLSGLPSVEYDLIRASSYREDFLVAADLSQPRQVAAPQSRAGTREMRKGSTPSKKASKK
ncbi:MAG: hypothetical protein KIT11_04540 [Fimbriimonadaceae bacterium]|nr:hypothetical protein [Fimbriimonadaceae bacterium]QYK56838.1 MAG: hypothetical protein KF733_04985 [Fimbriimonadaceae bacterium]